MKVRMYPHLKELEGKESGIAQVVINYFRHLPDFGIELVDPDETSYDLTASHAASWGEAMVHHSHGLLWTAHHPYSPMEYGVNRTLVNAIKKAHAVTVPSRWVAETFQRDMRITPHIVPHGVNWDEWQHDLENGGYVLWAKNRTTDFLSPAAVNDLAAAFPNVNFVSTFGLPKGQNNVTILGSAIAYEKFKRIVQSAGVLLASDKETWGILPAEAMAAGVPVLTVGAGAVPDFMPHGVAGYAYRPGDFEDAKRGLEYCLRHRDVLGENGRQLAQRFSWPQAAEHIAEIYRRTYDRATTPGQSVDVVIPSHNYGDVVGRAIQSAASQTYPINRIIVVDDQSTDQTEQVVDEWIQRDRRIVYKRVSFGNVAHTRNAGWQESDAEFIIFLDADDQIEPGFAERLIRPLVGDQSLSVSYTGLRIKLPDGKEVVPWDWPYELKDGEIRSGHEWPHPYDYDEFLSGKNQVPTCCLVRRSALKRVGGYRARYAPTGAGAEDAEMFLRLGAIGSGAVYVPPERGALFAHTHGHGTVSGDKDYKEVNWLSWHPWVEDGFHPFASLATPRDGRESHPIRYYDQPLVSVVIPVGPGHETKVVDALDSLEAQTLRNWEVIVVDDTGETELMRVLEAYPYVRRMLTGIPGSGAGLARNIGVLEARADYIAFLDADDAYHPDFLAEMLTALRDTGKVVYSDFVSRLTVEQQKRYGGNIIQRNDRDGTVIVNDRHPDFECEKAFERPSGARPYTWSGVTVVLPKTWHEEIGGFDEQMETWEDCDYLLRLAWAGRCFHRVERPLWIYDFTSGHRRENLERGRENLIAYMQQKFDRLGVSGMGCDCGPKKEPVVIEDGDKLTAMYRHRSSSKHMVRGDISGVTYGYIRSGTVVNNVAKQDIRKRPGAWVCPTCSSHFTITKDRVYCTKCREAAKTMRVRDDLGDIEPPKPTTPPPPTPVDVDPVPTRPIPVNGNVTLREIEWDVVTSRQLDALEKQLKVTMIAQLWGVTQQELQEVSGIGTKTSKELVDKALEHMLNRPG